MIISLGEKITVKGSLCLKDFNTYYKIVHSLQTYAISKAKLYQKIVIYPHEYNAYNI